MSIDARLDVIGLVVADMAASLAFYRRLRWIPLTPS